MATQFLRQTAVPCTLATLQSGSFISGSDASGIQTQQGLVSRASILGVLISKDETSCIIEDGTGNVAVRSFDGAPKHIHANVGDLVHVVGKPREYNGERYVALEICKRLRNPGWIAYRRKELEMRGTSEQVSVANTSFNTSSQTVVVEEPVTAINEIVDKVLANPLHIIMQRIKQLDNGSGVMIDQIEVPDADEHIKTLLEEGEIFEIRPGRVKVLE